MRDFHFNGRSPVLGVNGMVATSHPLASSEALGVLKAGGNAVDAAIAGAVLLGVCEPHMTGLGGDCFALVKPAGSDDVVSLNASGRAPRAFSADALRAEGQTSIEAGQAASITLPGAVDGFCRLSERFGKLGLDRSLAPAIEHFENGVPIAPRVAFDLQDLGPDLSDTAKQVYLNAGRPYAMGETLRLPGQADVLRRIAANGRDAFYKDAVAADLLKALHTIGGAHTEADFAEVEATWGTPITGPYKQHQLLEHPPNGQGATAILLCNILSNFDLTAFAPNGAERIHIEAEATKLAYDTRNRFLSDPDHMNRLEHMLAPETARQLAALIDPKKAMPMPPPLAEQVHKDTVLITVVDRDGMAISLIYSIFASLGSGVASPEFGILFHNRGCGFNLTPGHPNEAGPGKRPMHTILPAMRALNGQVDMTFGVMGGQYQATGHAHVMSNMIDFGMDAQEALDAPRAFADPFTGALRVENTYDSATLSTLEDLGHTLTRTPEPIGGAQAIVMDHEKGVLVGASDPRKDGCAIGY
ncbi:MAG: gamma-glutamyltransferase family protein [Pseudomonadota bacterium]